MLLAPFCPAQLTQVKCGKWENVSDMKAPLLVSYTLSSTITLKSTLYTQSLHRSLKKKKSQSKAELSLIVQTQVPLKHALG